LSLNNENPTQRREDAESEKRYENNKKIEIKNPNRCKSLRSFRLCVGFYDAVIRDRRTVCSTQYKSMILFD